MNGADERRAPGPSLDLAMAHSTAVIALFAAVAGVCRVAQDAAIAWRHGAGAVVDAYHVSMALVGWPAAFLLAMLTLLIPPVEAALRRDGEPAVQRWRSQMLAAILVGAVVALPLAWYVLRAALAGNWLGLTPAAAGYALTGLPLILPVVPLSIVIAVMSAWLISSGGRALTLLEALPPLSLLLLVLLAAAAEVLFWGTALAFALQLAAMAWVLRRSQALARPRWRWDSPGWAGFPRAVLALLGGQMLFALTPLIDPFFAARLGEGQVALMGYANRLVLGLLSLLGLGLQRAGMPLMSQLVATDPASARRAIRRWALAAALAGALVGGIVAALADPLVGVVFERGQFDAHGRAQVALLLRYGMIQVPLFLVGLVMVTALASERAVGLLSAVTATGLLAKVVVSALLAPGLGLVGLSLASAAMYGATVVVAAAALMARTRWTGG